MTAAATFTWDFNIALAVLARAASLTDLGDGQLVDDAKDPPIPPQMPYAAQLNQWALQLAGMNRIIAGLDIEVAFVAGNPVIVNVMAMSSILTTSYVTTPANGWQCVHNGAGTVIITWPAGTVPAPRGKPRAFITDNNSYLQPTVVPQSNGVTVYTRNLSGVLTDAPFCLTVF